MADAPTAPLAPTGITKKAASQNACCNCSKPIGESAKVTGVSAVAADGEGAPETWCPTCFVYHRAPLEPERWAAVAPAKCGSCGFETLLHGHANKCGNCRGSAVVLLSRPTSIIKA